MEFLYITYNIFVSLLCLIVDCKGNIVPEVIKNICVVGTCCRLLLLSIKLFQISNLFFCSSILLFDKDVIKLKYESGR
jgi:hypothetical protein